MGSRDTDVDRSQGSSARGLLALTRKQLFTLGSDSGMNGSCRTSRVSVSLGRSGRLRAGSASYAQLQQTEDLVPADPSDKLDIVEALNEPLDMLLSHAQI